MPEMPEVEMVRRTLAAKVTGRTIKEVAVWLPRLIKWPAPEEFQALITGLVIQQVERRGKYLLLSLSDDWVMVVHLRMTGRLQYTAAGVEQDRFARILFQLDNGDALVYADTRTLGTLYVMKRAELWRISGLAELGPEPLSAEFSLSYFQSVLQKRQGSIKGILLNQAIIGGLGNIYVDESLAAAAIHPLRKASSLSEDELAALYTAINQAIQAGIDHGGTTLRDYRDGEGKRGEHQHYLKVYGRKGQACLTCGTPIVWTTVAGRGTHYCPVCQKDKSQRG